VQEVDPVDDGDFRPMTSRPPTEEELADLRLALVVAAHAKSNSVVVARHRAAVGVGAGDQSRVGAVQRALARAGDRAKGAVAASDGFFPFRDAIDALAAAGITAVVAPSGSRNDAEVAAAAEELGLSLLFADRRHFRH
jgi:phosphoribosylaminoimidazolecarboxamide formyltransferase/IMP cyclohydrolase